MLRRKIKEVGQVGSARVGAVYVFVCMAREGLSRRWHHKHTYVWGRGMKAQQGPWNNIISVILPGSDSQPTVCLDPWIVLNVYFRQVWETLYIAAQPQKSCRCMSVKAGLIQSSKYVLGGAESWAVENFSFSQTMYKLQIKTKQWERIQRCAHNFPVGCRKVKTWSEWALLLPTDFTFSYTQFIIGNNQDPAYKGHFLLKVLGV